MLAVSLRPVAVSCTVGAESESSGCWAKSWGRPRKMPLWLALCPYLYRLGISTPLFLTAVTRHRCHLVCSSALNLFYSQQQRTPRHQHAQPHLERKNHSVTMAEDNEELNIRQPEQTDQNEEATPDPSAPPEKKGSTIGIIPTFIPLYST